MSKRHKAKLTTHKARLVAPSEPVEIKLSEGEEGQPVGPPTFASLAYSGSMVPGHTAQPRLPYPYVIDLAGTTKARTNHVNLNHKGDQLVGHLTKVDIGNQLYVEGALSAANSYSEQIAASHRNGMPWEVSIEGNLGGRQFVPAGQSAVVNGQTFQGPFFRMTKNVFTDIAFVSHGADGGNAVKIAASAAGDSSMNEFEKFILSCGCDPETITDEHRANLQAAFDAMQHKAGGTPPRGSFAEEAEKIRKDQERRSEIERMSLSAQRDYPEYREQIMRLTEAALGGNTMPRDFELELLRGTRIQAGTFVTTLGRNSAENNPDVIEAAICMSAGLPNIEKHFSEQVLNTADRTMKNFSLQQLLLRVAASNGYTARLGDRVHIGNLREVLEFCFPPATARLSGFSTISLPGILGSVANKEILAGYMEEDQTWTEIAAVKPVNNFHAVTSYRMLDNLEYEEVGPAGEIPHGTLAQESYTRQAKTYAKMLGLTRNDIINDDLGALDDIRMRLGLGAAKKFNNIFWASFINNSSFFTAARTNYLTGSTTNLGTDGVGLGLGVAAYRQMTTPTADGTKRIGVSMGRPSILLAPPELETIAQSFYKSLNLVGGSSTVPDANIHAGLYRPVIQDRLSDSAYTGYSTTAWFLFGGSLKPMVVSFLNGNRMPTIESSDADFNQLGIQFRGFHDFGADKSEYMSGLKVKGAS